MHIDSRQEEKCQYVLAGAPNLKLGSPGEAQRSVSDSFPSVKVSQVRGTVAFRDGIRVVNNDSGVVKT